MNISKFLLSIATFTVSFLFVVGIAAAVGVEQIPYLTIGLGCILGIVSGWLVESLIG